MTPQRPTTFDELRTLAAAGDARAQYQLAAQLSAEGKKQEADTLLEASAEQGFGDALYTLATRSLDDAGMADAAVMLERAVQSGSALAVRLLAVLRANGFGVAQDWRGAIAQVLGAARQGDPAAMREIAMLLLSLDPDDVDGALLLKLAAPRDPVAGAVLVRRACCGRAQADQGMARELLGLLQNARYPNVNSLANALSQAPTAAQPEQRTEVNWPRVEAVFADDVANAPPAVETVSDAPSVRRYLQAFSPEECEYVIASSARLLVPSMIADPETGQSRQDDYRSSLTAIMSVVDLDLPLTLFNHRLARLAGRPPAHAEALGVLLYAPGKEYRPHYDWLPPGPEYDRGGQRVTTALLYLNDEYEGGETHFVTPDIKVRGAAGDVVVFENILEGGDPDRQSRHAGLPVRSGAKWLGSTWYREKKYIR